jgi:ubiquinone/menaquinone biosynthesis C-methylase UbiE
MKSFSIRMPEPEPNGFIKTLNNMGYMTSTLDPYSEEFISFSSHQDGWSLDVGAAYGIATNKAILKGAKVIGSDLSSEHLEIIKANLPDKVKSHFKMKPGNFFDLNIENNSLSAILACRVLHFLRGEKIELAARLFHAWLKPKGRVYIVCETPYLSNFQSFIPMFEDRKIKGEQWPGFIDNVQAIAPERGAFLPKEIHLLDPDTLKRTFEAARFKTIQCATMQRSDFPHEQIQHLLNSNPL